MAERKVSILLEVKDLYSKGVEALGKGIRGLNGLLRRTAALGKRAGAAVATGLNIAGAPVRGLLNGLGAVRRSVLSLQTLVLAGLTASVIGVGAELEAGFGQVATLVDTTKVDMRSLASEIEDVGRRTGDTFDSLTKATFDAVSAGVAAEKAGKFIKTAADLALGGSTETAIAVDGLTAAMSVYGLEAEYASDVADIFFASQKAGKTTIAELSQNIGKVAGSARALGVGLDTTLGTIATLTLSLGKTEVSATGLAALFASIVKGIPPAFREEAKRLGVQFDVTSLQTKGLVGFIRDLDKATGGNIETLQKVIPETLSLNTALALMKDEARDLERILASLGDRTGATSEAVEKQLRLTKTQLGQLRNEISLLLNELFLASKPAVDQIIGGLGDGVRSLATIIREHRPEISAFLLDVRDRMVQLRDFVVRVWQEGETSNAIVAGLSAALVGARELILAAGPLLGEAASQLGRTIAVALVRTLGQEIARSDLARFIVEKLGPAEVGAFLDTINQLDAAGAAATRYLDLQEEIRKSPPQGFGAQAGVSAENQALEQRLRDGIAALLKATKNSEFQTELEQFAKDLDPASATMRAFSKNPVDISAIAKRVQVLKKAILGEYLSAADEIDTNAGGALDKALNAFVDRANGAPEAARAAFKKAGGASLTTAAEETFVDTSAKNRLFSYLQNLGTEARAQFDARFSEQAKSEEALRKQLEFAEQLFRLQEQARKENQLAAAASSGGDAPKVPQVASNIDEAKLAQAELAAAAEAATAAINAQITTLDRLVARAQADQELANIGLLSEKDAQTKLSLQSEAFAITLARTNALLDEARQKYPQLAGATVDWTLSVDSLRIAMQALNQEQEEAATFTSELERGFESTVAAGGDFARLGGDLGATFADGLGGAVDALVEADLTFGQFARRFLTDITKMILKAALFRAVSSAFGFNEGGEVPLLLNSGGSVPGPNVNRDVVPAMLTPREHVMPVPSVDYYGRRIMTLIQNRVIPREFFDGLGGLGGRMAAIVGRSTFNSGGAVAAAGPSTGGGSPTVLPVMVTGAQEMERLIRGGANAILELLQERAADARSALGVSPS